MPTVIVFPSKTDADTYLQEVAVTPEGGVWTWYDPDSSNNAIQYNQSTDGRCAVAHNFSESDRAWLEIYLEDKAQFYNELPSDWQYREE
ncbi:MAG: hypothetical protein NC238_03065 [Dehalobacter sp.]|nr:hypothetical protein [Dehalobacter sp.]